MHYPRGRSSQEHAASERGQKQTSSRECSTSALPSTADVHQGDGNVSFVPNSEVAASFGQAPSRRRRNCGGECSRLSSENLAGAFGRAADMPTLPRVGTAFLRRGINFFRPQLRNGIWDRSVKLSGFYRSGARHISATDLTQYLLADLIVRVENTGFSYASPRATRIQA